MSQPIKADEVRLRLGVLANGGKNSLGRNRPDGVVWVYDAVQMNENRAHAMLDKWDNKGWWEFGVSLRSGWLTPEGWTALTAWKEDLERREAEVGPGAEHLPEVAATGGPGANDERIRAWQQERQAHHAPEVVDFRPDIGAFSVTMAFDSRGHELEHPPTLTTAQAEAVLIAAMRVVQVGGQDPWAILDTLAYVVTSGVRPTLREEIAFWQPRFRVLKDWVIQPDPSQPDTQRCSVSLTKREAWIDLSGGDSRPGGYVLHEMLHIAIKAAAREGRDGEELLVQDLCVLLAAN